MEKKLVQLHDNATLSMHFHEKAVLINYNFQDSQGISTNAIRKCSNANRPIWHAMHYNSYSRCSINASQFFLPNALFVL